MDTTPKTLDELQEEAASLGAPEAQIKLFNEPTQLAAFIETLRATAPVAPAPTQVDPAASPSEEKETEESWRNKADKMRDLLMKQPKIRMLVPLEGQEKIGVVNWVYNSKTKRDEQVHVSGAVQPVTLNGFTWLVIKGDYDNVPEQVANVIGDKLHQTANAGKNLLLDRTDPATGQSVRNQLS